MMHLVSVRTFGIMYFKFAPNETSGAYKLNKLSGC